MKGWRSLRVISAQAPRDARFFEIVGRHFHFHAVPGDETDETLAHFAADRGEHHVFIVQFDAEHRSSQHRVNATFYFDSLFFHMYLRDRQS